MGINRISTPADIAVSGLKAEALRMNVIANNIANSNTTRTDKGEPFRRKEVVLSTSGDLSGVSIEDSLRDTTDEFKTLYQPGHPDADKDGFVKMPNVDMPVEMMSMVVANRAYQANAAVLKRYQETVETALELLR
jgi:flagellar basal-body rod protein FlgC